MLKSIHHINILVRDLDAAITSYRQLGVQEFIRESLPGRGVQTARFKVADSWVVLLMPTDPEGVPGRHLAQHGEGLFLLSFGVDSLDAATDLLDGSARRGLADWRVADLNPKRFHGAVLQLCESAPATHSLRGS